MNTTVIGLDSINSLTLSKDTVDLSCRIYGCCSQWALCVMEIDVFLQVHVQLSSTSWTATKLRHNSLCHRKIKLTGWARVQLFNWMNRGEGEMQLSPPSEDWHITVGLCLGSIKLSDPTKGCSWCVLWNPGAVLNQTSLHQSKHTGLKNNVIDLLKVKQVFRWDHLCPNRCSTCFLARKEHCS